MKVNNIFADKSRNRLIYLGTEETGKNLTLREMSRIALKTLNLKYGVAIDTRDVLNDIFGITNTDKNDPTGIRILPYERLVRRFADDMLECLLAFGFKADKTKKILFSTKEDEVLTMNHNGGNIVYTNYPWTVVSKAIYAAMEGLNAMKGEHEKNVDISRWKADFPAEYENWQAIAETKKSIANELEEALADSFDEEASNIIAGINSSMMERHKVYSELQPNNYGKYPKY